MRGPEKLGGATPQVRGRLSPRRAESRAAQGAVTLLAHVQPSSAFTSAARLGRRCARRHSDAFLDETPEVSKAFKLVNALKDKKALVALLVPEAWTLGGMGEWDEKKVKRMKPKERAAYKAAHDAAYAAHTQRHRYFHWVLGQLASFRQAVRGSSSSFARRSRRRRRARPSSKRSIARTRSSLTRRLYRLGLKPGDRLAVASGC